MQQQSTQPTSIRSTVHLLVDPGSPPTIAAHVETVMGQQVAFVTLATDHRTSTYTTGTSISFSGEPGAVRELLTRCLTALGELTGGEAR
jgi:hypothetical protein